MKLRANMCVWHMLFVGLLMCALAGLVLGCSMLGKKEASETRNEWVKETQELIADSIENPDTKTEMLAIVDQVDKDFLELVAITRALYADFTKLNDSYKATPEDYQKVISEFEVRNQAVISRIIENRFKIKEMATPEEWADLTDNGEHQGLIRMIIEPNPETKGGSS